MTKTSETIVFFGSGPVAAESLRLLAQNFVIEAVITKPRAAHHKGPVPVLELVEELGLPVHTAESKKTLDELFASRPVRSRVAILIDFGIIVSQHVIDYFELGIINSHFSLLPEWRGADPITFSILSGQEQTGVSLMLLTAGMDEGPLLAQSTYNLTGHETAAELTAGLIELSNAALGEIIPLYLGGQTIAVAQDVSGTNTATTVSYSRKLTKADGELDFSKPAAQLEREIRAFNDWPKSRATIGGLDVVVTAVHVFSNENEPFNVPGTVFLTNGGELSIATADGVLIIDRLKPAGKKEMLAADFIRGYSPRLA